MKKSLSWASIPLARSLTFQNGRINRQQIQSSCARFASVDSNVTRVVVTHHPFDDAGDKSVVGRAKPAMNAFAQCGVDLIASGHGHVASARESAVRYSAAGRSMVFVQAGTATSARRRGANNSFNLIRIDRPRITIERMTWDDAQSRFASSHSDEFVLRPDGWSRVA